MYLIIFIIKFPSQIVIAKNEETFRNFQQATYIILNLQLQQKLRKTREPGYAENENQKNKPIINYQQIRLH